MTRSWLLWFVAACTPDPPRGIAILAPAPAPIQVEVEVTAQPPGNGELAVEPGGPLELDQPPHIKLRLGHYSNRDRGIGLVIDRTQGNLAKVRFDHDERIWRATAQAGPAGRLDYMRSSDYVLLYVWEDGRTTVYVPDPQTERGIAELALVRDGDALSLP
jgi:hypothetical protein